VSRLAQELKSKPRWIRDGSMGVLSQVAGGRPALLTVDNLTMAPQVTTSSLTCQIRLPVLRLAQTWAHTR